MSLGRNLKIIIKREKCKIQWLTEESGVSQPTINSVIREDRSPRLDTVYYLFNAMGYDLYLVSPDGRKQKYESVSGWIKFIMTVQHINIEETPNVLGCCEDSFRRYMLDEMCPLVCSIQTFLDTYGYSIKVAKGDIEYDLFEPIDIWKGKC